MKSIIQTFYDAVTDTPKAASQLQKDKKIIGHLCSYTPEELIHAAGFHPMRLFPSGANAVLAEDHLQAYCCEPVRGVLEDSLAGRLDFLHGAVFAHSCDALQRLSDIWRLKCKTSFFADVLLPAKLNTQSAEKYMIEVLDRFRNELATAAGKPIPDEKILMSIRIFNTIRKHLTRIREIQSNHAGLVSGQDFYMLVRGSMIMDRQQAATLLAVIADNLENKAAGSAPEKNDMKRIIITGPVCDTPGIYPMIENAGGLVVADDLCTGERWFNGFVAEEGDPLQAIAKRLSGRIACPAKHISATFRSEHLTRLVKTTNANGVIFLLQKFCDPHAFDYPYLKDTFNAAGIKNILIETDGRQENIGQLATRIETFIEMI